MYRELGGRSEYRCTPLRELQEIRISIIAELNVQDEQHKEMEEQRRKQERELERQRSQMRMR